VPRAFSAALKTPDLNLFLFKMEKFPSGGDGGDDGDALENT
jgi:hypothetical protein